ncbi:hypothetical protein CASFOL_001746 [Castilleja foliolosa]|uniref:Mitochondrial carrier protein n=1 Tax=Castilleja foliolosa TaxID=1961234 RepID=A0ABD3ECA4_9LAMI
MWVFRIANSTILRHFFSVLGGKRGSANGFSTNLKFARIGGVSKTLGNNEIGNVWGTNDGKEASRSLWSEAAAVPSVDSVLRSALAGGLSCALSTAIMHPVDTVKVILRVLLSAEEVVISLVLRHGLFRAQRKFDPARSNSCHFPSWWSPARLAGSFILPPALHGLRTGICEASKLVLVNVAPTLPEMQVESVASFCGTFLGTAMRIPCEVLKQRLQAGLFENVGQAIVGTWRQDGLAGFFRGTGATLCREIPFYVAGMGLYAESKKAVQRVIGRELQPWETVAVGAISGGLTAVLTTPIDVIKTKMMIATQGQPATLSVIVVSIL